MLPHEHFDRIRIAFDDHRLVANAGLILPATLALHLGLPQLVDRHLDLGDAPGRANPGDKISTLVASALAGGDCQPPPRFAPGRSPTPPAACCPDNPAQHRHCGPSTSPCVATPPPIEPNPLGSRPHYLFLLPLIPCLTDTATSLRWIRAKRHPRV